MAARSRRPGAAELGRRIWEHLHGRAEERPGEFRPTTRDDVTGWLWDGVLASVIREAVPGIADSDLRRAREYLNASGIVVNMGGRPARRRTAAVVHPRRLASGTGRPCPRGDPPSD